MGGDDGWAFMAIAVGAWPMIYLVVLIALLKGRPRR